MSSLARFTIGLLIAVPAHEPDSIGFLRLSASCAVKFLWFHVGEFGCIQMRATGRNLELKSDKQKKTHRALGRCCSNEDLEATPHCAWSRGRAWLDSAWV